MMPEERRISPAVAIIPIGLAGVGLVAVAALALAAPPKEYVCPYCGVTFATQEELNYHIQTEHPAPPGLANLYGKVTDAATGGAIEGAEVMVNGQRTYTDENGYYAFTELEPGSYAISASKEFYEDFGLVGLVIEEGDNTLDIELVPITVLVSLTGLVADAWGQPIQGVKVGLDGAIMIDQTFGSIFAFTDSNGAYAFDGLEPRNYTITFEKEGYHPVTRNIAVLEDTYDEQKLTLLPPTEIVLHFTNPRFKYGFWDLRWRNLGEAKWKYGEPFGAKAQDIPCTFSPELVFLLQIMEWDGTTGACWLGPYLVEVPSLGERTWNSRAGSISGGSAVELTATDNECVITGILEAVNWGEAGWGATILVDGAEDVSGKVNVGEYFIGDRISSQELATLPRDGETGSVIIQTGRRVICNAKLFMEGIWPDTRRPNWKLWDFRYYPEYPPEYYEFWKTHTCTLIASSPYNGVSQTFDCQVSVDGNAPEFKVVIMQSGAYNMVSQLGGFIGPGSASFRYTIGRYWYGVTVYANPDVNAAWSRWAWKLNNWQVV